MSPVGINSLRSKCVILKIDFSVLAFWGKFTLQDKENKMDSWMENSECGSGIFLHCDTATFLETKKKLPLFEYSSIKS